MLISTTHIHHVMPLHPAETNKDVRRQVGPCYVSDVQRAVSIGQCAGNYIFFPFHSISLLVDFNDADCRVQQSMELVAGCGKPRCMDGILSISTIPPLILFAGTMKMEALVCQEN